MSLSDTAPGIVEIHETPHPSRYRDLLHDAGRTRRCPVLFGFRALESAGGMPVPDDPWTAVAAADPPTLLPWSGPDRSQDPATFAAAVDFARDIGPYSDLAVIDAARPADVPLAMRWSGARSGNHDLVSLCAVLRSWEDRFGAVLTCLGSATLLLSVADPPRAVKECDRVAAEHFAFCPDQVDPQNGRDPYTIRSYGRSIRRADLWRFWWD